MKIWKTGNLRLLPYTVFQSWPAIAFYYTGFGHLLCRTTNSDQLLLSFAELLGWSNIFTCWPKSQLELKPMEMKSLSVKSEHCLLLPLPAGCSMNSCCATKGQREAPQFALVLSHPQVTGTYPNYRQSFQCRTGCTVDSNWNVNHLSPKLF